MFGSRLLWQILLYFNFFHVEVNHSVITFGYFLNAHDMLFWINIDYLQIEETKLFEVFSYRDIFMLNTENLHEKSKEQIL